MLLNNCARFAILSVMGICVLVPFALLLMWAFSSSWVYPYPLPDFSLERFENTIESGQISAPLKNSIVLSLLVTFLSFAVGLLPAKYFGTREFRGKTALYVFLLVPAVTPGICIVFGLIGVLIKLGIYKTFISAVLAQVAFTTPYFIFTMIPVFKRYDSALEEQSAVLGVGKLSTLLNVTLPAVKSGLATSLMLTFVISWSMYLLTSVTAPRGYSTMATTLLPLLSTGYATDSFVAITAVVFIVPALISLLLSTFAIGSDKTNSKKVGKS